MPEIELWSLFTHELASSPWRYDEDPEIKPVLFGKNETSGISYSPISFIKQWAKGGEVIDWLISKRIQAIVLYGYNDLARLRIVRWAARRQIPCFIFGDSNIRGDLAVGLRALVKRIYVPWVLRQTTGVFHCGSLGKEYFQRYGVKPERLYPFPYEPNYALFARLDRGASWDRHRIVNQRRTILFAGRMVSAKRPDLLIAAFTRISDKRPTWDLMMLGEGPLRKKLQNASLGNRVKWLGFIADPAELAALYSVGDVFVLPSDFEPWGVVLTEAATRMALVASSAVGAAADLIIDGLNGKIFLKGDVEDLAQALLEVTEPKNIDEMKAASPQVLRRWRESTDPIRGLRKALRNSDLLSDAPFDSNG